MTETNKNVNPTKNLLDKLIDAEKTSKTLEELRSKVDNILKGFKEENQGTRKA